MDIILQAGIGLFIVMAFVWLLILKRKAKSVGAFIYAGVMTVASITAIVWGMINQFSKDTVVEPLGKEDMLALAGNYAVSGGFEQAQEIIDEYSEVYGYDEECSLLAARMGVLQGMEEKAEKIYDRLGKETEDKEQISKAVEAMSDGTEAIKYARVVLKGIEVFNKYADADVANLSDEEKKEIKSSRAYLSDLREESQEVFNTEAARNAYLNLNLLVKDYEKIAEVIDEGATHEEMLVVSELYLNGVIDGNDFSEEYAEEFEENAEDVGEHLVDVYEDMVENISSTEATELKSTIESWDAQMKHPELTEIKNTMTEMAEEEEAGSETSKVNLGVAKIEHYFEDEASRDEHIYEAIITSPESQDEEYVKPMEQILQVVQSNESNDEMTNISSYASQAIENSLPPQVEALVPKEPVNNNQQGNNGNNGNNGNTDKEENKMDFSQAVSECVNKRKGSLSIGNINTDRFEEVKASVIISSDYASTSEELKELIAVYDCGIEIKDFTIEKVNYSSVKTMLICDVSGSMSGSIGALQNAVSKYVNSKNSKESIAIVTFNDGISGELDFGATTQQLLQFTSGMGAGGGTAIFDTLHTKLQSFASTSTSNDVIIVMTDGCDGYARDYETIVREIGGLADSKGITVYTLGLGDVDTGYLNTIAEAGNGSFVYAEDDVMLESFYNLLHSQVDNQYIITYKAADTLTQSDRTLEIRLTNEDIFDIKSYSIGNDDENNNDNQDGGNLPASEIYVGSLSVRTAYKGKEDIENQLIGDGFNKDSVATLKLKGNIDYNIELKYLDENTYTMTIPSSVAVGVYDVEVTIDGKRCIIKDGFTLCTPGSEKTTSYGPYVFTSVTKTVNGDRTTLSGDVTMNGWLKFKGELVLQGDLVNGASITVIDNSGSYVTFDEDTAEGLGKFFAEKSMAMDMPKLGEFTLYNDALNIYDYDNYNVDSIQTNLLKVFQVIRINAPVIKLYPDKIKLEFNNSTALLPFQDTVFSAITKSEESPFNIDFATEAVVTDKNLGLKIEFEGEDNRENYRSFTMFNAPIYLDMNKLKICIDTIENEYTFGGMVKIAFLDFGLGAEITLKGFTPDKFSLTVDKDVTTTIGPVPITFGNFTLGAEDIADALESKDFRKLKITGGIDISAAKVSAFFPKLKKFVGDVSVLSLPETTFTLDLEPLSFSANAQLKLFEEITLAKAEIQFGTFDYTNALLDLDNEEVFGIRAALSSGIEWDIKNCSVEITGTGEFDALSRFIGVQFDGKVDIDIKWWVFKKNIDKKAKALVGVYFTKNGDPQFTVALQYKKGNKNKRLYYYIDKNGKTGDKNGTI